MNTAKFQAACQKIHDVTAPGEVQIRDPDNILLEIRAGTKLMRQAFVEGLRVKVLDGSGQRELGLGTLVDHVTVYVTRMEEGMIESPRFAEEPFDGGVPLSDNPKIVMDNGTVHYGCQVWWEPLPEDEQRKES